MRREAAHTHRVQPSRKGPGVLTRHGTMRRRVPTPALQKEKLFGKLLGRFISL